MANQLLETKLYAPRPRDGLIARPRLDERLRRGLGSKLTLISAPAGFGKTTLIAQRLAARADRLATAWLSLDEGDDDPASFLAYLVAALEAAVPGVGGGARLLLASAGGSAETVVTVLLNDLADAGGDVTLVLDDYHVIDAAEIHASMTFLLDHLPPGMHVVIATRADPPLPLARMRVRGELLEIRAGDLRFTPDEAAAYLGGPMGLTLSAHDVDSLERRTEGWIAALQLAGLSLQGRSDATRFIDGFAGDDRYVVDYLVEEVLARQPEALRGFLLQTSILGRLHGPLCDAVTGQEGGRATLELLERRNLFLVPLDDRRRWYRYHHLFADMLRAHLLAEQPELVPVLHRRAAVWLADHGDRHEAIGHALAGGDAPRAADLIETATAEMHRHRQERVLRGWFEALPRELFRDRPVLAVGYVGALMSTGELAGVDGLLRDAERWLEPPADPSEPGRGEPGGEARPAMVVVDTAELDRLPSTIATYRAAEARMLGDVPGTIAHAQRALDLAGKADHFRRGSAGALLGLAHWSNGDLDAALRWYGDGMDNLERAGFLADVVGGAVTLGDLAIAQGRLGDAGRTYERALRLATRDAGPALRGAADMHVGLAALAVERDDLDTAGRHLLASRELGDENGMPQNPHRSRLVAARIRRAEGDADGAFALLEEAERRYVSDFSPAVRPISALTARLRIATGDVAVAVAWIDRRGLSVDDELSYVREFEHATLARVLLAAGVRDRSEPSIRAALGLLARLRAAAEDGGRWGSVIDVLVAQALAQHAAGDPDPALVTLGRAVELAQPEGYMRIFLEEGPPMEALLRLAAKQPKASSHVRRLLGAISRPEGVPAVAQPLIEPLSERELEVLRLLEGDLDGPDLARTLSVSLPTVRTHTRNIYAKLGVNNRRAAVRRAAELGLLTRTRDLPPPA